MFISKKTLTLQSKFHNFDWLIVSGGSDYLPLFKTENMTIAQQIPILLTELNIPNVTSATQLICRQLTKDGIDPDSDYNETFALPEYNFKHQVAFDTAFIRSYVIPLSEMVKNTVPEVKIYHKGEQVRLMDWHYKRFESDLSKEHLILTTLIDLFIESPLETIKISQVMKKNVFIGYQVIDDEFELRKFY
jgi:hypothetical protein